jgi:hypothetical protein
MESFEKRGGLMEVVFDFVFAPGIRFGYKYAQLMD